MNQFFMYDAALKDFQKASKKTYALTQKISVQTLHHCYTLPPFPGRINDVRVRFGGVVDADGNYVTASGRFRDAKKSLCIDIMMGKYDFNKLLCPQLKGEYIYCGEWLDHWGHFLLESTTRLWYVVKYRKPHQKLLFVTREKFLKPKGNYKIFFKLLGVDEKDIVLVKKPTAVETLIIPDATAALGTYYTPEFKIVFDAVQKAVKAKAHKRIYLSRCRCAMREIMGEEKLEKLFKQNGFEIVYPEQLPLDKLVALLKQADYVAGLSGSGMHNALFCGPKTKLIVLNRSMGFNVCQGLINEMNDLDCVYVDAYFNFLPTIEGPYWMGLTKPLKTLCAALKWNDKGIPPATQKEAKQFYKIWGRKMFKQKHALTLERFNVTAEVAYDLFSEISHASWFHQKKDLLKYTVLSRLTWGKYHQKYSAKLKNYQNKYGVK